MDRRTAITWVLGIVTLLATAVFAVAVAGYANSRDATTPATVLVTSTSTLGERQRVEQHTDPPWETGLFEDPGSPELSRGFDFDTRWNAVIDGKLTTVFSGAYEEDALQGVIMVQLWERHGGIVPGTGGLYLATYGSGSLRIEAAEGNVLTLSSESGDTFYFDAEAQELTEAYATQPADATKPPGVQPVPQTDAPWPQGILEHFSAPFPAGMFLATSVWQQDMEEGHMQVYAGEEGSSSRNAGRGMLAVRVMSYDLQALGGGTYKAPLGTGPLTIVAAEGSILTVTAATGETFYFDAEARQLTDSSGAPVPTDSPTPTPEPLPTGNWTIPPGLFTDTPTPTVAATPAVTTSASGD